MDTEEYDEPTENGKPRFDKKVHRFVQTVTESSWFNGGIIFIIITNAFFMALETSESIRQTVGAEVFEGLDYFFMSLYSVEFIMKIYAEPINYWTSAYNLFDFVVLVLSFVQGGMEWAHLGAEVDERLGALKTLRALRTLRTLRTVSFIRGLQVLVTALLDTIRKWVVHIILLLFLLMFLFGIMGYYFFGYKEDGDKENWGSLSKSMLTLFSFVTVDGWTDLHGQLDDLGFAQGGRIFTIAFIILGHFIFTNVFIGVIIMNISESGEAFKREQQEEKERTLMRKKEFMILRQHQDVTLMMERQKKGHFSNFHEMVHEFQKGLRHEESIMVTELCTNIIWLETFIRTMDHMDNTLFSIQQLHFEMANLLASVMEKQLKNRYGGT